VALTEISPSTQVMGFEQVSWDPTVSP